MISAGSRAFGAPAVNGSAALFVVAEQRKYKYDRGNHYPSVFTAENAAEAAVVAGAVAVIQIFSPRFVLVLYTMRRRRFR